MRTGQTPACAEPYLWLGYSSNAAGRRHPRTLLLLSQAVEYLRELELLLERQLVRTYLSARLCHQGHGGGLAIRGCHHDAPYFFPIDQRKEAGDLGKCKAAKRIQHTHLAGGKVHVGGGGGRGKGPR